MIVNIVINIDYLQAVRKTKHNMMKESPAVGPRTRVEPANGFPSTGDGRSGCSEIRWSLKSSITHFPVSEFNALDAIRLKHTGAAQ